MSTKPPDSTYAKRLANTTSETQARSILSERFYSNDVNLLINTAYSCKDLTANISNSQTDWDNKFSAYMDSTGGGGGINPMVLPPDDCQVNRDAGLKSCDQTEWFMIACSILGGFLNPWLGGATAIETKIAADECRSSVQASYQKCEGQ